MNSTNTTALNHDGDERRSDTRRSTTNDTQEAGMNQGHGIPRQAKSGSDGCVLTVQPGSRFSFANRDGVFKVTAVTRDSVRYTDDASAIDEVISVENFTTAFFRRQISPASASRPIANDVTDIASVRKSGLELLKERGRKTCLQLQKRQRLSRQLALLLESLDETQLVDMDSVLWQLSKRRSNKHVGDRAQISEEDVARICSIAEDVVNRSRCFSSRD